MTDELPVPKGPDAVLHRYWEWCDQSVKQICILLYSRKWPDHDYDYYLDRAVSIAVDHVAADAVAVLCASNPHPYVCYASGTSQEVLSAWETGMYRDAADEIARIAGLRPRSEDALTSLCGEAPSDFALPPGTRIQCRYVVPIGWRPSATGPALESDTPIAILFYRPTCTRERALNGGASSEGNDPNEGLRIEDIDQTYSYRVVSYVLPMFVDVFSSRDIKFSPYSPKTSNEFWGAAQAPRGSIMNGSPLESLRRPTDRRANRSDTDIRNPLHRTVTLALDLRKSTTCMELAISEARFAEWLHTLVEKLRAVTHYHNGVFDKFTGDGALVHFLADRQDPDRSEQMAIDQGVQCAVDLQRAIEIHLTPLREMLIYDSPVFGAGIGIASGEAHWSAIGSDPTPIVVGKGVVSACRVCDKAPCQTIRMTNYAFRAMSKGLAEKITFHRNVEFHSKEHSGSFPLLCKEFKLQHATALGMGSVKMAILCESIRTRIK